MRQQITIDTIVGKKQIPAPSGWNFNTTDAIIWNKMLHLAGDIKDDSKRRTVRQQAVLEGQLEILANVLGNSLGMSAFYWTQEAYTSLKKEG